MSEVLYMYSRVSPPPSVSYCAAPTQLRDGIMTLFTSNEDTTHTSVTVDAASRQRDHMQFYFVFVFLT